jgi:hypothetical protein
MGYTTDFSGEVIINPRIKEQHKAYINQFNETRRMKRSPEIVITMVDPIRNAADLPIGDEGCYFVGAGGLAGQDRDRSIVDYNTEPKGQPGLWCQWRINDDGNLVWDGCEKFYDYIEWLKYLIQHFFKPWGYVLNGEITWEGENRDDFGTIYVNNNIVSFNAGKRIW